MGPNFTLAHLLLLGTAPQYIVRSASELDVHLHVYDYMIMRDMCCLFERNINFVFELWCHLYDFLRCYWVICSTMSRITAGQYVRLVFLPLSKYLKHSCNFQVYHIHNVANPMQHCLQICHTLPQIWSLSFALTTLLIKTLICLKLECVQRNAQVANFDSTHSSSALSRNGWCSSS